MVDSLVRDDLFHPRLHGIGITHIAYGGHEDGGPATLRATGSFEDESAGAVEFGSVTGAAVDGVAAPRELGAEHQTEPARGTGDEGNPTCTAHGLRTTLRQPSCFFWKIS